MFTACNRNASVMVRVRPILSESTPLRRRPNVLKIARVAIGTNPHCQCACSFAIIATCVMIIKPAEAESTINNQS